MALTKVHYTDNETVIGAKNLNDIQDEIIANGNNINFLNTGKVDKVAGKGLSTLDFTVADRQAISNAYVKPTAGVPKTDLSQDVQTSLDKADNSLQAALDETLTVQGAAADAKATGDAVGELKSAVDWKAPAIFETASGASASFPDGAADMPLKSLLVNIEPVQSGSGDPSPTNVRPISGWTGCNVTRAGVNLWDEQAKIGYYINATTGEVSAASDFFCTENPISVNPSTNYYFKNGSGEVYRLFYYDANGDFISCGAAQGNAGSVFSTPADCYFFKFWIHSATYDNNISVNAPSTDTDYHPGASTIPISWQTEAGTVYGGTLDVTTGVLTVTDANIASYNGETLPGEWISDRDVYAAGTTPTTGAQVVYKLATPQTYHLTPQEVTTLLGTNNIWADCGGVEVEYRADTKLYIQKINAPADDDMTADAQIASGKYFIIGNNLYLSTTTIPAGDTIIPGTNCQKTNLAAALNALNT